MIKLALTGGIACGKSRAAEYLARHDVSVCEADRLAHRALNETGVVRDEVLNRFGRGILGPDGAIDRRVLGEIVFAIDSRRRELEAIVHPFVVDAWTGWLAGCESRRERVACVIVPLLFECNFHEGWDEIVCVVANRATQMERLRARGLGESDAEARLRAQMNVEQKMRRSNFVIVNNGDASLMERQADHVLKSILEI